MSLQVIGGSLRFQSSRRNTSGKQDYDALDRVTHDRFTTLGTDIKGAVRRLSTTYEIQGANQAAS